MKRLLKWVAVVFLAVAAFSSLISIHLPLEFGWAGLFCWFLADLL